MLALRCAALLVLHAASIGSIICQPITAQPTLHNGCDADEALLQEDVEFDPGNLDHIGQSIAIGDFNDDGIKDIVMGGYTRSSEVSPAITPVVVFLGTGNSPPFNVTNPAFRHRLTIHGGDFDLFGFAVAFIGDLNDDECDELVVGSPRFDGTGLQNSGRVSIFFGRPDLEAIDDPPVFTTAALAQDLAFDGAVDNGWFGASLGTARGSSGSYLKDLLIGAPGGGPVETSPVKGSVYQLELPTMESAGALASSVPGVLIGASSIPGGSPGISGSPQTGYVAVAHRLLNGTNAGDRFGHAIAFVGNVDAIGGQEYLVGAPQYQAEIAGFATKGPGYARLFSLASGTPLITINGTQNANGVPPRGGEAFGFCVAGSVKLDLNDSVPDLLIGSPLFNVDELVEGQGKVHAGRVRAFSGASAAQNIEVPILDDGAPNHTVMVGADGSHQFGFSVIGIPDISLDGVDDVLCGAWQASIDLDSLCVPFEPHDPPRTAFGGSVTLYSPGSSSPETPLAIFYGEVLRDHMGRAVAWGHLFGSSSKPEIVLSGLAWTPEGSVVGVDPTEIGKGYLWDGDTVVP